MVFEHIYLGTTVVAGIFLGLLLPAVIQASIGKISGGDLSLSYSVSLQPIGVEFHSAQAIKDWQIRLAGASKLIFPIALFTYLIALFPHPAEYRYGILSTLIVGTLMISWTDLLAIENPQKWSLELTRAYRSHEKGFSIFPNYFPGIRDRPATYFAFLILIAFAIALALEQQNHLNYVVDSDNPPFDVSTTARIVGGIGSVVFSIILVMLYDKQASISETQSVVQKEQAELMRRERQPRLSGPYNFKFWGSSVSKQDSSARTDTRTEKQEPNPNSIQFFQTNAGEGMARNFRLNVIMDVDEGPHNGRGAVCAVQRMDRFPLRKFGESDLQGGEKDVEFMTEELKLTFTEPNPEDPPSFATYKFEEGINTLVDEGTTRISLKFTLTWEDEFEERYSDQVYHTSSDLRHDMDLLDIIQ